MLTHLLIENYSLIEKLDVSLNDGLTVITGETGAGKSILLGALSLILGQRADTRILRDKSSKCVIEGTFSLINTPLHSIFSKHELDYEEEAIFRREISPSGKSRAFINDSPVTLQIIREVSEKLIDIHSQHESLLVGTSTFQFDVADSYAGQLEQTDYYRKKFAEVQQKKARLNHLEEAEQSAKTDLDYFRFQYDELEKADLDTEAHLQREEEIRVLHHAETILLNIEKAVFMLQENTPSIYDQLHEASTLLSSLAHLGNTYEEMASRLESLVIETKDIAGELVRMKEGVEHNPEEAAIMEAKIDQVNQLMHKHHVQSVAELHVLKEEYRKRIEATDSLEAQIAETRKQLNSLEDELNKAADTISAGRQAVIPELQEEVLATLKELGMPGARFEVACKPVDTPTVNGKDHLSFLFNANVGGSLQELSMVASGGELSRFMLTIKRMISKKKLLPTIIFDEIDTGISGETSNRVANILEDIARGMQVIAITHLPQIASRGETHFLVYKEVSRGRTNTYVRQLDEIQRTEEIAKMLGGESPSKAMYVTAKELISNKQQK